MIIRNYQVADKTSVMQLLHLNTPAYFAPEEYADLAYYLDNEIEYYFVIEINDKIVGCGGINQSNDGIYNIAKLSWDIFHPNYQRQGLGTILLSYRLEKIMTMGCDYIMVRTSQLAYPFYEKLGFRVTQIIANYWADGLDLYQMRYSGL